MYKYMKNHNQLKRCSRCGLPETYETLEFDTYNVCNICHQAMFKQNNINWDKRKEMFLELIAEFRGKYDYDCIVPFSGGKDSTFTLYHLVTEYKLKPLVVQFNHGFMRPTLLANNELFINKVAIKIIKSFFIFFSFSFYFYRILFFFQSISRHLPY